MSRVAVHKAIKDGRLRESVVRDANGHPKIADVTAADEEWTRNTRASSSVAIDGEAPRDRGPSYGAVPSLNESRARRESAEADRAEARAAMAQLDLAERRNELVQVELVAGDWERVTTAIRIELEGLPAALGTRLTPAVAAEAVPIVEELLHAALTRLADAGDAEMPDDDDDSA